MADAATKGRPRHAGKLPGTGRANHQKNPAEESPLSPSGAPQVNPNPWPIQNLGAPRMLGRPSEHPPGKVPGLPRERPNMGWLLKNAPYPSPLSIRLCPTPLSMIETPPVSPHPSCSVTCRRTLSLDSSTSCCLPALDLIPPLTRYYRCFL